LTHTVYCFDGDVVVKPCSISQSISPHFDVRTCVKRRDYVLCIAVAVPTPPFMGLSS